MWPFGKRSLFPEVSEASGSRVPRVRASRHPGRLTALLRLGTGDDGPSNRLTVARRRFSTGDNIGALRSIRSSVSLITSATSSRANHLWSAGITYQGASLVLVAPRSSRYAAAYFGQF